MQDIVEPGKRNYWKGMPFLIGALAAVSIMAGVKWYENNDVKDVSQTETASEERESPLRCRIRKKQAARKR